MSTEMKKLTQEQRTKLSDNKMFEAAMDLIVKHGTSKTTLKEIGENAGYSRGLANSRFGSKEKLFEELVKRCYISWVKDLESFIGDKTGLNAFLSSIDAFQDFLTEAPQALRVLQILWYESISQQSAVKAKTLEHQERMLSDITGWLARAQFNKEISAEIDVADFSIRYLSFIFGIVYMWLLKPQNVPVERIFNSYKQSAIVELEANVST